MHNQTLLTFLGLLHFFVFSFASSKPNLIVIMCDDLGYADVGFNGCKEIPTPHIDSIAANGVRFSDAYVAYPVCGPSRAAFLTGRYGQRFGFERNPQYLPSDPNMGLPKEEKTIAERLKPVGYKSGIVGKWHMGAHLESHHPLNRGFDYFYGHLGGGHRFLPEELTLKDSYNITGENDSYRTWILKNHEPVPPKKYLTDEFSDEAVAFVERNQKDPFFLFLSYNAPHLPLQATDKYLDRFPELTGKRKIYAAMVSAVDDGVGRLLKTLDELELSENTLVFFLSDNGGPYKKNASENTPLKGGKGDIWEGGNRVPFALQWKGKLEGGREFTEIVSSLDIMATICDLSQAPKVPEKPLDGVHLIPYLTGSKKGVPHESLFIRKFDQQKFSARQGAYKLVLEKEGAPAKLYNLQKDITENENLANQLPEKTTELEKLLNTWTNSLKEPQFLGLIHSPEWQKKLKKKQK